ncbi:MAG: serine--tRNA ligase [Deltaproteobacteria bacterium]|nr:serine--tRNA ligase [Deltaproteobacteria bacterium]
MLDIKAIENDPDTLFAALKKRGEVPGLDEVRRLSKERKAAITEVQEKQQARNEINKGMKGASKEVIEENRAKMKAVSTEIKEGEAQVRILDEELTGLLLTIPNVPLDAVPDGLEEEDNVELKKVLEPKSFSFDVKDHVDLGVSLDIIDFERAAKVSGSRFIFLKGAGCVLNRALTHYMIDFHANLGDLELAPPYLVTSESMLGTGQLPKFADDAFKTVKGDEDSDLYLIPTAEVPLTNFFADEILDEEELPKRIFGHTPCFRAEAGSAGRDTRGLIRQHQFDKVEMVRFALPEQADDELEKMVARASQILEDLELPHRTVMLCGGDLGFAAEKTIDIEVWLPGQNCYREISSCSSFGSFQARRAKIRYRPKSDGPKKAKPKMLVTLNGSGLAVGRTLVAILENHQQEDGSILIPEKLRPYMRGKERIVARS